MELADMKDLFEKAREGELQCPKCGATGVSLQNVRVGMGPGKPFIDPSAYGLCGKCGSKIAIEKLQTMSDGVAKKQWWQFWK